MLACLFTGAAHGQPLSLFEDTTNTIMVTDLTGFAAEGDDMAGMQVTVFSSFFGTGSETIAWGATGAGTGGALGNGWSLSESGDTFGDTSNPPEGRWMFDVTEPNMLVDRILLTGVSGQDVQDTGVVFDRTVEPNFFGTDGSAKGRDFEYAATAFTGNTGVEVTYIDLIDSQADGPGAVGDLFAQVDIDFVLPAGGGDIGGAFGANDRLLFYMDTDLVGPRVPGDCPPGGECDVPEPGTCLLLLLGLAGGGFAFRQRAS